MTHVKEKLHAIPTDLKNEIFSNSDTKEKWNNLTPLGKNEFICWIISAKKSETRERRIIRTIEELHEGKRRPCCWPGCPHRKIK